MSYIFTLFMCVPKFVRPSSLIQVDFAFQLEFVSAELVKDHISIMSDVA